MRCTAVLAGQRGDLARRGGHAGAGGIDRLAQLGQRKGAGGPLQQARAQRRFQPRHVPADRGGRHAEVLRRGREAAAFDHAREHGHRIKWCIRHRTFPFFDFRSNIN
ncbi:hypothetical protein D3C72_1713350 [compost metagenome]